MYPSSSILRKTLVCQNINMKSHLSETLVASASSDAIKDDFFGFMMIRSNFAIFSLAFSTLGVILVPFFFYSIIWFNSHGSDKKITFLNMITSASCWIGIEYNCIIQTTEIIRFCIGPLPEWFCFLKTLLRNAYVTQVFLYFDTIALTRYLFIFWLKNPAAFHSDFWILFLNIWIRGASLIFNGVWSIKSEHQIISFYVCSGIDPTEDFKVPLKLYAVIELGSIIINVFVWIKVQMFKRRSTKTNVTDRRYLNWKKVFLTEFHYESIANFTTSMANLLIIFFLAFGAVYLSGVKPKEMQNHRAALYLQYLVAPCFASIMFVAVYYLRHKLLRQGVFNQILEIHMDLKEYIA